MIKTFLIFIGAEELKIKIMFIYIGPGLGGGAVAVIIGFFVTIFTFFIAVFWIPLKKFFTKHFRNNKN